MPKRVHSASDRDDINESTNASKRTRKAVELTNLCQEFYDGIRACKNEDGRILCENFIRVPNKRANADHSNSIDLTQIQQKIHSDEYTSFEQFLDDIELLLNNAKTFYRKNSIEWKDANELSKYFYSKTKFESIDTYYFEEFFTAIYNAQIDDRPIVDIFLFLPSRKIYPDYYLIVTKPIDLKMIAIKIQNNEYVTLDDMENDLLLMISNARKYNDPKSQIYKDACALKKIITNVRNELDTALKSSNDKLRLRKRDVLLSSEVANMDYPEEPDDEEIQSQQNDDADSETSSLGDEDDSYRILYNAIRYYKLGAQSLIDPFIKLPKKRFHQDYYEEIQRPIAMSLIKNHIKKGKYTQLEDLVDDMKLMFDNAMQYNQEGSLIFNSAKKLLDVTLLKAHELGYDEQKPRIKEARINLPMIPVKDEYLESSSPQSPNSQRGRLSKKPIKTPEQNIQIIYTYIREYRENDIGLIAPFLELPSSEEYPDYYETIEEPIDMSMIKDKMDKGIYKREQDIIDDLNRMFNNAKVYNVDESYIFKYASRLEQALATKSKTMIIKKEKPSQIPRIINKKSVNSVQDKISYLIQSIKTYTNRYGRTLSTVFLTLPSKIDYPDYYEIIQKPIDLKRIELQQYSSINDLSNDMKLMFDNALLYNEPGSMIYRDALNLQRLFLEKKRDFIHNDNVQNLVCELLICLFIQTFNYEDQDNRYTSDSFSELPEQAENEPFDIIYTFDLVRQNLDKRRYHRLDVFQDDLFKVFERARRLTPPTSPIYQDSIKLQRFYIHLRDDICQHGSLLRSPALLFNEDRFQQELVRERTDKDSNTNTNNQNSISPTKSSDSDENKISPKKSSSSAEKSSLSKGETYYLGDFVYIEPTDESNEPVIVCIESFEHKDNEDYLSGLQFIRPNETYHSPTHKFLRQEVFLTQTVEHIPMNKIQNLCYVLNVKDYFKYQPIFENQTPLDDQDVYVCESRYNMKTKTFRKVKWWNLPENKRVKLIQRDVPLENIRMPSTLVHHRSSTIDNDLIDKIKETIFYDSVINDKLNENSTIKKNFYEQIVISSNNFYKVGDFVYVTNIENNNNNGLDKRFILRIDKIWKENESYCLSGPVFIQPSDIINREQLIVLSKCLYEREVFKRDGPSTQISLNNIKGKCSVLSLKHFCTHRLTEVSESDVYVCESKYVVDDHSLRGLSKPLKRISLSSKATADEIWTFRKELLLKQDVPGGLFKLVDDSSTIDTEDQLNSILNGDEHHSNFDNNLNSSFSNRYNNNRKSNRRTSTSRPPSGYLVFASDSRKRLVRDNPGIPFGEMSRIIGDQWRRLSVSEREKYEERARERAREQDTPIANNYVTHEPPPPPSLLPPSQRIVNGGVAINGYYPNVQPMNSILPVLLKAPITAPVNFPPRIQRVVHSETYSRYIDHLKNDHPFISDWPKQLKASIINNGNISSRTLPSHWLINNSPGFYNNVYEALWSMRDNMWSDVVRVRNVLSDEW
ncbi:unnamed protein product [Adineta steineri]|uniref:Protein polybromo-1 n=1 Tax=Adineta steineri TaxID=433720 RepID=A0A819IMT7_9BILA|nr:unnamed protein product [Adineta steineri]